MSACERAQSKNIKAARHYSSLNKVIKNFLEQCGCCAASAAGGGVRGCFYSLIMIN
jgi:hypothetical protein